MVGGGAAVVVVVEDDVVVVVAGAAIRCSCDCTAEAAESTAAAVPGPTFPLAWKRATSVRRWLSAAIAGPR